MKIIIPMAGRGSRLRPHTLTVPKPLIPIAGKPIVERLVEDICKLVDDKVEEIAFIIGDFGKEIEENLLGIAEKLNTKGKIFYQQEALGTAHAILCANECLNGNVIVAFADTLFRADFKLNDKVDGTIWVKQVQNPSAFGVVKINENNVITDFVEKPIAYVSDLAIIGIYYFKDGEWLKKELQYLIDNNIKEKGEYQLTNALENMKQKGAIFTPGKVKNWLDCGNYRVTVETNKAVLDYISDELKVPDDAIIQDAVIIPPCFIGKGVEIKNAIIGPYVSIGNNSKVNSSVIKNSLIQNNTMIENANLINSMIGNNVVYQAKTNEISLGDFNEIY